MVHLKQGEETNIMPKNVAVIAEYNPFHKGHAFQLKQLKEQFGAESILVIMSGDFVQRGEPALVDKHRRTRMALLGGADMVVELPPAFSTSSAEIFARGAVRLAEAAGCIDTLAFGAAFPDRERLEEAAALLSNGERLEKQLKEGLRAGYSYPAAVGKAVESLDPFAAELLKDPNNLLAVEYIKAIRRSGSLLQPLALPRIGSPHSSETLPAPAKEPAEAGNVPFASATAVRNALRAGKKPKNLAPYLPDYVIPSLDYLIFADDFSAALSARLLQLSAAGPEAFLPFTDSSPELAVRLAEQTPFALTFSELTEKLRTRAYTAARVRRFLLHILLDIRKNEAPSLPAALRILGLKRASTLPAQIKRHAALPLISKTADAEPALWKDSLFAHHLYLQTVYNRTGIRIPDEYRQSPLVL